MIQDIAPHSFSLDYGLYQPEPEDIVLLFQNRQVALDDSQNYPTYGIIGQGSKKMEYRFLFSIDQQKYFLALSVPALIPENLTFYPLRHLRNLRPMYLAFAGYTAWHLCDWYRSNRFCGRCGQKMFPGSDERKMVCPSCGMQVYPRINPCIIVAVHDGDRLLMTKYANRPVTWFVLIAGFIEIGETAEDTVRREVMEETGVKVKNIRYFGSQPWGIPGNLTLGFTAELEGSDKVTLDTDELSDSRWFPRSEVPVPDDDLSITAAMIRAFANGEF